MTQIVWSRWADALDTRSAPKVATVEWDRLADALLKPSEVMSKKAAPLAKLARFGDIRNKNGSLRHAQNILEVFGAEGDYDGEVVSLQEAGRRLKAAGIEAVVHTTARHAGPAPRWRVFSPTSKPYPPSARREFAGRINAALGGILSAESFTLGQCFFVGQVKGVPFEAIRVHGQPIDQVDIAPVYPGAKETAQAPSAPAKEEIDPERLGHLLQAIPPASMADYNPWFDVIAAVKHLTGGADWAFEMLHEICADWPNTASREYLTEKWESVTDRDVGPRAGRGTLESLADQDTDAYRSYVACDFEDLTKGEPAAPPAPLRFPAFTPAQVAAQAFGEQVWWWGEYLPAGEVTLMTGHGAGAKSTIALGLAVAVAAGVPFLGKETKQGRAVYFSGEDPIGPAFAARLSRVMMTLGVDWAAAGDRLLILDATEAPELARTARTGDGITRLRPTRSFDALKAQALEHDADLLVIDNASDCYDGDENQKGPVRAFMRLLVSLVRARGGSVLLLGHMNKAAARGIVGEEYGGSVAWNNSARSRLTVHELPDKELRGWEYGRQLNHDKANLGRKAAPLRLFWNHGEAPHLVEGTDTTPLAPVRALVSTIMEFTNRGERVPAATRGSDTAKATLGKEAPADLREVLREAERLGWIEKVVRALPPKYAQREFWEATPAGAAEASKVSTLGPEGGAL